MVTHWIKNIKEEVLMIESEAICLRILVRLPLQINTLLSANLAVRCQLRESETKN